jgi:hypothetical protein
MGSAIQIHAIAGQRPAHAISNSRALRLLNIDEHKAWREFAHWWESRAAHGVPNRTRYTDRPRQSQVRPAIEDRLIWSIDMERSFCQLAYSHRELLIAIAEGESMAFVAHRQGTSIRTLLRRRDLALQILAGIRRRYAEEN